MAILLPPRLHAVQSKKVRLAFSALAYANPPFWIAHELKLFEKYGLDSEFGPKHPSDELKVARIT